MVLINIQKRDIWLLSGIIIFLVGFGFVYGYGTNDPAVFGHSSGEIIESGAHLSQSGTYSISSKGDGTETENMGFHSFCTLSKVASGGFNSYCDVYSTRSGWMLRAYDPNDAYADTQRCSAACFDLT
jgi:hypothetical protein